MHTHSEEHHSPYSTRQLFTLVADVKHYPQFIPWAVAARIHQQSEHRMVAELKIRFAAVSSAYTSEVLLSPPVAENSPAEIRVNQLKGPFRHLMNHWEFIPAPQGGSIIRFRIEFAFATTMFERLIGGLFDKAAHKMVTAFEERAHALYGSAQESK